MKFKAVLFDLDGTLLNTSEGVIASVRHTIETLHYNELNEEQLLSFIGPPVKLKMKEIYHLTDEDAAHAMDVFRSHYGGDDLLKASVYEGLPELLSYLRSQNIKIGVATYKREDMAKRVLEHCGIASYFDAICGSDVAGNLTKADVVRNCMHALNADEPDKAVMIGDSDNDAIGAKAIGLSFVGVTYGFGFKSPEDVAAFENCGCAATVPELQEILTPMLAR